MWGFNLKHGVQYTRAQRQTQGLKLHERGSTAKVVAQRVGASASSVYSWTKELREKIKQERDAEIARLREEGMTQQEVADELEMGRSTVAEIVGDSKTGISDSEPEIVAEPTIEDDKEETGGERESEAESATDEPSADKKADTSEPEPESLPSKPIPDHILKTARAVMGAFAESRPNKYVARLEASPSEWMTITDDSLSNELERELLTSAAAMCLWQEWMIWYQGENSSAFTDTFGKIGADFVRGEAGQWSIVSKIRSILRRLRE